ncbi:hypothetical protein F2Q70_00035648 [Brassica cretica]|uniref:Uncharacterized protein n=1 Tax=Brassica cretica TaxID=69181 RepID=A0A8S9JVI9_BRACR|nr:hypothetical protein F2Q68_00030852 [Brassica cretica]KAF2585971.1 hypothetical protein F2Q70_00035648 [Brassica cretica]
MTHKEFAARHSHPPSHVYVNNDQHTGPAIDRQRETAIDRQPPAPIDQRAPLTFRMQMPKIYVARLNALRPQPKPSANPPETTITHSDDAAKSMEADKTPMGRTLRKRKGKRSSGGIVRDLEVQIGNALVPVDFHVLDIKLNWNSSLLLERAFLSTVGATEYSASIETHTATSIDSAHQKSFDRPKEESVDSSPRDWENDHYNPTMATHTRDTMHTEEYDEDYEEERAVEYRAIRDEEERLIHYSSWKKNAPSIDRTVSTSIDTHPHQTSQKRASTDIAYYPSTDTGVDRVREGDYMSQEQMNLMRVSHMRNFSTCKDVMKQINTKDPDGYARAIDGHALQISREDIADILQMANGAENLFMQQHDNPSHQQRVTSEIYNTTTGVDDHVQNLEKELMIVMEKDEYGVYRDDHGHARDVDGHIISVSKEDIRSLLERASRDEHNYICLPQHASSFTQTRLVPEIYTKDGINEMFYGVYGAQEKNGGDFQMKLDGVYYPLNDSIGWLTTCMEEMRQDIAKIQTHRVAEATAPASIDRHHPTSIDDDPQHSDPMKSQQDSYARADIDQLVEGIY